MRSQPLPVSSQKALLARRGAPHLFLEREKERKEEKNITTALRVERALRKLVVQ